MTPAEAPLGVYIHWPYCARICPYCDFNVVRERGRKAEQAALVEAVAADLQAQAAITGPRRLASIFFGGGTPSLMDPEAAGRLIDLARRLWTPEPDIEIALEANPTDAETQRFEAFAAAGVERLSLGVQALDDASLAFLKRNHDAAAARTAAAVAARTFPRFSLDLIYALPGQTTREWAETLTAAAGLGAGHLSPYQLTIEAGTAFERAVRRGRFAPPHSELGAALYETTQATLEALGFDAYEVSNHARGPAERSRHNLVYWRGWDYVGVGPGAHGRLSLAQGRLATQAETAVAAYVDRVGRSGTGWASSETLDPLAAAEERLISGLRIDEGVDRSELGALDAQGLEQRALRLQQLGLLAPDPARLRVTREGRLLLDRVLSELLA